MEEVTADTGFEGRVLACRLEAWARSPPPRLRKWPMQRLGPESWTVGAQRHHKAASSPHSWCRSFWTAQELPSQSAAVF